MPTAGTALAAMLGKDAASRDVLSILEKNQITTVDKMQVRS